VLEALCLLVLDIGPVAVGDCRCVSMTLSTSASTISPLAATSLQDRWRGQGGKGLRARPV